MVLALQVEVQLGGQPHQMLRKGIILEIESQTLFGQAGNGSKARSLPFHLQDGGQHDGSQCERGLFRHGRRRGRLNRVSR